MSPRPLARRVRLLALLALAAPVATVAVPASARPPAPLVNRGWDLFVTPDGSHLGVDLGLAEVTLVMFRGVPLGTFDFGRAGVHATGGADTVVRRLDAATPGSPQVRVELVGLLLESTNVPGWYVTLQSARSATDVPAAALGLPSTGTLDLSFARHGGGMLRSELLVNYDVRRGAPDGPIVASGSTGMGFAAEDVVWQPTRTGTCPVGPSCHIAIEPIGPICHATPPPIAHQHCVETRANEIPLLPGVNHLLNGEDTSTDFHSLGALAPAA